MKLILAVTPEGGIGLHGQLPWTHLVGDLPRFRRLTLGNTVVMGRKTWESLPSKPLKDRMNLVVSSTPISGVKTISVDQIPNTAIIIGGATLVKTLLPQVSTIFLSTTHISFPCDTFIDIDYIRENFVVKESQFNQDHIYEVLERCSK